MFDSVQRSLVTTPTPVYLTAASFLGYFALSLTPSFIPIVLLLAILRVFLNSVFSHAYAWPKVQLGIGSVALSATLSAYGPATSAVPEVPLTTALFSMFWLSFVVSGLAFSIILADISFRSSIQHPSFQLLLFPTIWATALYIVSRLSPLGYLSTWSPVEGISAYSWLRPYFGPPGIDWVVGAWAVVLSELLGMWIMGEKKQPESEELLIQIRNDMELDESAKPERSRRLMYLSALLCLGALPSYLVSPLPTPVNSESTFPLSVACALPFVEDFHREPSFDEYLKETQALVGLAKVVLWPEGAVQFPSAKIKQEAIERISTYAAGSVIGLSFEYTDNSTAKDNKLRNGFMLIDNEGLVLEYYKRHLVPFVESNVMVPSLEPPKMVNYELVTKRNSRGKPIKFLTVPITVSICLDFASNAPFAELDRRPSLILGPARTWHTGAGMAIWEQAKARAEELGSALLWCDGDVEGVSGIAGRGTGSGEVVQVGRGSWVRAIGLDTKFDDTRTFYGRFGIWPAMALIWGIFGVEWLAKLAIAHVRGEGRPELNLHWRPVLRYAKEAYRIAMAWKRSLQAGRQADAGESAHLL